MVELLVVITVIGIIAGLAIPAVMKAMSSANQSGMQTELESLNQGIEAYKEKYGDYPPDFSNWSVVQRHYLKIFPDIDQAELLLLYRLCDIVPDNDTTNQPGVSLGAAGYFFGANTAQDTSTSTWVGPVMDRAEALVWALGGFSSDPQHPFTGTGGPLQLMPGMTDLVDPASYHYNPTRDNFLVEFDPSRLSVVSFDPSVGGVSFANRTQTNDEPTAQWGGASAPTHFRPDLFPAYRLYKDASPVVYFDARTYAYADSLAYNGYTTYIDNNSDIDGTRPVYSAMANLVTPSAGTAGPYTVPESLRLYSFMNARTFQLIGPGLDRRFGAVTDSSNGASPENPSDTAPTYCQYPSGKMINATATATPTDQSSLFVASVDRFDLTAAPAAIKQRENHLVDNLANFCKTFGDKLP